MIPNITRGGDALGVVRYLVGKGRREEHRDPHLVAGSPEAILRASGRPLEMRDAGELARFLDEPRALFGTRVTIAEHDQNGRVVGARDGHVWHCSLSLHPDEPELGDKRWSLIAQRFMDELGFAGEAARAQCRWVALRHGRSAGGSDHLHIVVTLVAEDGSAASVHYDRPRAQRACRELEREFGLRAVEARGRGAGERGIKAGELDSDRRRGRAVGERSEHPERGGRRMLERVVRACATAAADEGDFVTQLRRERVLVRPRFDQGGTAEVVGYSVALPPRGGESPVWYGGGRLSRELTLPRLRAAWPERDLAARAAAWRRSEFRAAERNAGPATPELQARCARQVAELRERLRAVRYEDQTTWALVARDTAGVLAAWSLRTEAQPGALAEAGRAIARTAQVRASQVPDRPRRPFPPTQDAAQFLLRAANWPPAGSLLLAQITSLAAAVRDMHAAAGEAERAAELQHAALTRLAAVASTVGPAATSATDKAVATARAQPRPAVSHRRPDSRGAER